MLRMRPSHDAGVARAEFLDWHAIISTFEKGALDKNGGQGWRLRRVHSFHCAQVEDKNLVCTGIAMFQKDTAANLIC